MKFKGKETRVKFSDDARIQYDELKSTVAKEQKDEIKNSFNQQLLKSIDAKIEYEIISLILEWMDHEKYDKTFGGRKR